VSKVLRWAFAGGLPIVVVAWMTVGASAGWTGQQLVAQDNIAYTHCTSGNNQDGNFQNHCFATPFAYNAEPGWWWQYGINESWYNSGGGWIQNTSDWIPPNPKSDWYTVWGP
jgi:hypothetical protein